MYERKRREKMYKRREYASGKSASNFISNLMGLAKKGVRATSHFIKAGSRVGGQALGKASRALGRGGRSVAKRGKNIPGMIARNPKLVLLAAATGTAAYAAYDHKKELDEEEEDCMKVCYPEDWLKYTSGEIRRDQLTYKDETVEGQAYLDEYKDEEEFDAGVFCTKENHRAAGIIETGDRDHCDKYCNKICANKPWWEDPLGAGNEAAETMAEEFLEKLMKMLRELPIIGPFIESFEEFIPYIVGFIFLFIVFKIFTTLKAVGVFKMFKKKD
jgi:hypothetical protein